MVDDNPVERAALEAALPGLRTLGKQLYYLKRVLLWSAETQTRSITDESARRTAMMQAQVARESIRSDMPLEEFLTTLELRITLSTIRSTSDMQMHRALELLNKTNQFNTTGVRHTLAECHQRFAAGDRLHVVQAEDRFTRYGLIGAAWVGGNCIEQMVMSCRALGLGLEDAFLAHLTTSAMTDPDGARLGRLHPTAVNFACQQLYSRNGFVQADTDANLWIRPSGPPLPYPPHVTVEVAG